MHMREMVKKVLKRKFWGVVMMNSLALLLAAQTINLACAWVHHQPEVPDEMMKFRKF